MAPHALLYDVHGNPGALEAVLTDARAAGAERFVLGGDYALFGTRPKETLDSLLELEAAAAWIRGNTDRWIAPFQRARDMPPLTLVERAREYCLGQLGDELAQELAGLPERQEIEDVLFCHASPRSDMDGFSPQASERDDELIGDEEQTVIVFGHTHLQFQREARGRLLVNPGSVGMPFDGDRRAAYALWRGGRDFELRRVEYDSAAYALELRSRMARALGDTVDTLVRRIEQAALVD